jgi:outer membrane immunogenic protein
MKNTAIGITVIAALISTPALAADLGVPSTAPAPMYTKAPPPPPAYSWTGFYLGLNAGYGWATGNNVSFINADPFFYGPAIALGIIPASLDPKAGGFIGGGQAGYNWQNGQVVYGIEADIQYASISGSASTTTDLTAIGAPIVTTTAQNKLDWFGTLRPRLGFTVTPSFLVYATGGLAYGQAASSAKTVVPTTVAPPGGCAFDVLCSVGTADQTRVGWTAGAGVEYELAQPWSVKVEYLYVDLGRETYNMPSTLLPAILGMQSTTVFHENIVRGGVNYKF